jgi:hypothetical protein
MFWSIAIITQIGQKELHTIYFLVGRLSVGLTAMKPNSFLAQVFISLLLYIDLGLFGY